MDFQDRRLQLRLHCHTHQRTVRCSSDAFVAVTNVYSRYHWYLAIICNVNKIKRKPVFEDFDEDLFQTHNRSGEGSVTKATETKDMTGPQPMSPPKPSNGTQDTLDGQPDDDVNLFDAEPLSLVNPEDTGAEIQPESETNQTNLVPHSPQAEPTEVAQATANAKSMPASILSQTTALPVKSKVRRKPAQPKRDPSQPVVLILDSLPGNARSGTVRALKDWIEAEGDAKRGMEVKIKENGYYPKASQIPMQSNYTDCGVYLLGYVEKFFQNPDEFKNKLLTGSMSAEEDWPELKPEDMRQKMREIIVELHEQQELERKSKKVKKGVTQIMTPPAPPPQGPTKPEIKAPVTERLPTKETRIKNPERQPEHTLQNADEHTVPQSESHVRPTQLRLASPIEFDRRHARSPTHSVSEAVGKVSDSPPGAASPTKPAAVTPRPSRTPRRSGPEVRIPVKTPQSNTSARSGRSMLVATAQHHGELRRMGRAPRSVSPTKRRRPHADDAGLPAAKKQSPRQRSRDRNMASSPLYPRSREGSAPSQPIEIEDSQEANPTDARAQRKPPSRSGPPKPPLRHSPSFQEIERPSPKKKHRRSDETFPGRALEDKLDEQDYEKNHSRCSQTAAPPSSLNRTEEVDPDSAEEISLSTGRMQLDGADDDAVVRETPEPGRRSPDAQAGWSKNDPLPL
jgi:sentrin-specific protease 7